MCFSATASFTASAVLGVTGAASLSLSRNRAQRVLSGIPLLFAVQQFAEGFVWLSLMHSAWAQWQHIAMYSFLFFAQMLWPVYVPLSMLLFETDLQKRKIISWLSGFGVVFALYVGYCLYQYPVYAVIDKHHIRYELGFALSRKWYYGLLYFLPTIVAPVISSVKRLHWLGYLFLGAYVVARLLFHFFVISVWCFFGAIISIVIIGMVLRMNKTRLRQTLN
jgi:hypothetical protein